MKDPGDNTKWECGDDAQTSRRAFLKRLGSIIGGVGALLGLGGAAAGAAALEDLASRVAATLNGGHVEPYGSSCGYYCPGPYYCQVYTCTNNASCGSGFTCVTYDKVYCTC